MANHLVYKNTGAEHLDEFYGGTPEELRQAYAEALRALEGGTDGIVGWAQGRSGLGSQNQKNVETWLGRGHADRVIRHGYEKAIEVASGHKPDPLPIETLFVRGCGDDFEAHICEGRRSVTVVLFVPSGEGVAPDYGSRNAKSKSWVVRVGPADGATVLHEGPPPVVRAPTSGAG